MKCSVITGPVFGSHNRSDHIECNDRITAVIGQLPGKITIHPPAAADITDLQKIHHPGYLSWVLRQCSLDETGEKLDLSGCSCGYFTGNIFVPGFLDPNTYLCPTSCSALTYAAGSAIAAAERALDGENCFALVRPPGHHAASGWAMGFCIINNIAVAAAKALDRVSRVAIVDWDVHHGNGTQEIFYASDRVLYCSVHADDFFPNTGAAGETGTGPGKGFTINIPLRQQSTIADYAYAFRNVILPALERFRPDLILVSAGQDGLSDDPVHGMALVPDDYGTFAAMLASYGSPVALVLEGGYGPSNPLAVNRILEAMDGSIPDREIPGPQEKTREIVAAVQKIHGLSL